MAHLDIAVEFWEPVAAQTSSDAELSAQQHICILYRVHGCELAAAVAGAAWQRRRAFTGEGNLWLEVFCPGEAGGRWVHLDHLQSWVDK